MNSIDKILTIRKDLLTEASTAASTYFEGVIVACVNHSRLSKEKFTLEMKKDNYVQAFIRASKGSSFATSGKTKEESYDILYDFAQICKKRIPGGKNDAGFGQSKPGISPFWTDITGKGKDTSKTDVMLGGKKCSVKGPIAQLMSGKKAESKATILSAIEESTISNKLKKDLLLAVDNFVDNTRTIGEKIDSGTLKKMTPEEAAASGNAAVKEIIDEQEKNKDTVNELFASAFKDQAVGTAFAFEAMTGYEKFGGKSFGSSGDDSGEATHMVIWDYKMDRIKFVVIDKSFSAKAAGKMSIRADLKSGSYKVNKKKYGYNFYQAIRVSAKVLLDKTGEIQESANEQITLANTMLTEGTLDEGKFLDKLKDIYSWVAGKLKAAFNWFVGKLTELRDSVKELLSAGIHEALNVFEVDVNVNVKTTINW